MSEMTFPAWDWHRQLAKDGADSSMQLTKTHVLPQNCTFGPIFSPSPLEGLGLKFLSEGVCIESHIRRARQQLTVQREGQEQAVCERCTIGCRSDRQQAGRERGCEGKPVGLEPGAYTELLQSMLL